MSLNTEQAAFLLDACKLIQYATEQGFSSKHWAFHLGLKSAHFKGLPFIKLDKTSIGIEICNWGYLVEKNGKFLNYVGKEVKDVCKLDKPYKGFTYFENYTKEQIASTKELLLLWREKYGMLALNGRLRVTINIYTDRHAKQDVDNLAKSILDGMQRAGAFSDGDHQVYSLGVVKHAANIDFGAWVSVCKFEDYAD